LSLGIAWLLALERWNALPPNMGENAMAIPGFDHIYSKDDWRILETAHRRACVLLDRDPKLHPFAARVARSVMIFFDRGERDFGRLAAMAAKCEFNVMNRMGKPEKPATFCPLPGYRPWASTVPPQVSNPAAHGRHTFKTQLQLMVPRLTAWQ
jgi:hypothetical protein